MNKRPFLVSGIVALVLVTTLGSISPVGGPAKVLAQPSPTVTIVHGCGGRVWFTNVPATWSLTVNPGALTFGPGDDFTDIELDPGLYTYTWTDPSATVSPGGGSLDIHSCPGSSPLPPTVACATRLVSFTNTPVGWQLATAPANSPTPEFWDSGFDALGPFEAGTYNYQWYNGVITDAYQMADAHNSGNFVVPTACPTAIPTATPTATPTPTASPTPTATPTATASPTPTATPTAIASPAPTATPTATPTPTTSPTSTATPTPTASPTPVLPPIEGSSSEPSTPLYLILGLLLGAALVLAGGAGFLLWKRQVNPNQNGQPFAGPAESQSHEATTDVETDEIAPPNEPLDPPSSRSIQ